MVNAMLLKTGVAGCSGVGLISLIVFMVTRSTEIVNRSNVVGFVDGYCSSIGGCKGYYGCGTENLFIFKEERDKGVILPDLDGAPRDLDNYYVSTYDLVTVYTTYIVDMQEGLKDVNINSDVFIDRVKDSSICEDHGEPSERRHLFVDIFNNFGPCTTNLIQFFNKDDNIQTSTCDGINPACGDDFDGLSEGGRECCTDETVRAIVEMKETDWLWRACFNHDVCLTGEADAEYSCGVNSRVLDLPLHPTWLKYIPPGRGDTIRTFYSRGPNFDHYGNPDTVEGIKGCDENIVATAWDCATVGSWSWIAKSWYSGYWWWTRECTQDVLISVQIAAALQVYSADVSCKGGCGNECRTWLDEAGGSIHG